MSSDNEQPMFNRKVIITRPLAQSAEIRVLLETVGATVLPFPMIETVAPDSWAAFDAALGARTSYDWLLFTSANGVRFFLRRLAETENHDWHSVTAPQIGVIGAATASALAPLGRKADVIAIDSRAEGLLKALINHLGGAESLRGLRFLIPRARIARDVLPEELVKLGAIVKVVEAYQTIRPIIDTEPLLASVKSGAVAAITFTSSSTVHNFIATIGEDRAPELLQDIWIACIGPLTANTARQYKLKNILQPDRFTATALVDAIVRACR
jgi:uroporphyrinogen III methyltransferase / synthase